ncbi:hypothetical protein DICPUDRAFT_50092 [Dictyostelium purpureum]|uniref:Citrate synthase n=1 Tax=Dictyostelium purpureum TaxID=5786 RepID=F0ZWQ5_DICPU|nr:uncharacterized protein DICPUDRAFT_50092 [Dictyostelium purpureum]EGC31625.1 hypothetical protein DICPUDRAFT_50092 [Dictyostelium purpureum]|eukprot:XP_003291853.1 hypothetical protein DICPUDRAFT_50092 [Dictyostelium purpureum]
MSGIQPKLQPKGLSGTIVTETKICSINRTNGITYRGYNLKDLAATSSFEEVAFLLIYGELPNQKELNNYLNQLASYRKLEQPLKEILERIPKNADPMDVLNIACSFYSTIEPESSHNNEYKIANRLIGSFSSILLYWYHWVNSKKRINTVTHPNDSISKHFLKLLKLKDNVYDEFVRALDVSLILYAEHGLSTSTFTARVTASTLTDMYSCVSSAIGALKGPLHGGANERVIEMLKTFKSPEDANDQIMEMIKNKKTIMGFGHRVYNSESNGDPRNLIIKEWSKRISKFDQKEGGNPLLFSISERVEDIMLSQKQLHPNLDFYTASTYDQIGIPLNLFTPLFALARVSGWSAHIIEQRSLNSLIRPTSRYLGTLKPFPPINERVLQHNYNFTSKL